MGEYIFGLSQQKPSRGDAEKMEAIAARHGCTLVETSVPGTGYQRWFAGPNRGWIFDQRLSDAVYADLRSAGLLAT